MEQKNINNIQIIIKHCIMRFCSHVNTGISIYIKRKVSYIMPSNTK